MTTDTDLCYLSATSALAKFRSRELSPVELVEALIARAEEFQPHVNAFTHTFYERALTQAIKAEQSYAKGRGRVRKLEGVPVAIKDLHPIKGEITTSGSRIFATQRDSATDPCVERLLRAGAILLARTATPEFGAAAITHSPLWGVTRNPWNLAITPGGSSGGAAAAVAAGMVTLADGSDYGGSIRIPAGACGVFGYKPPWGRNPSVPPWSFDMYSHMGPITRTVADSALMQNVMSGVHPRDITSLRQRVTIPPIDSLGDVKGWKIAYDMSLGYHTVDSQVVENTLAALRVLEQLGAEVEPVDLGWTSEVLGAFETYSAAGFAASFGEHITLGRYELSDYARARIEFGLSVSLSELAKVRKVQGRMYDVMGPLLERYQLFVCPTTAVTTVAADHDPEQPVTIEGKACPFRAWYLCNPFNMLGQLPVASVPTGFAGNGVPTGMQLVARSFDDLAVFRAAAAYEHARPWLDQPQSRPHPPTRPELHAPASHARWSSPQDPIFAPD